MNELRIYVYDNGYDSDALIEDLEDIIYDKGGKMNDKVSNLCNCCANKKCLIYFKAYIRYYNRVHIYFIS